MLRCILAVITGYLAFAIPAALWFQLTGHDPRATPSLQFGIASVLFGIVCAMLAGFVASHAAKRNDRVASIGVGVIIAAGATASLILEGPQGSIWSQVSVLLLIAPATYVGGILYRKQKADSDQARQEPAGKPHFPDRG